MYPFFLWIRSLFFRIFFKVVNKKIERKNECTYIWYTCIRIEFFFFYFVLEGGFDQIRSIAFSGDLCCMIEMTPRLDYTTRAQRGAKRWSRFTWTTESWGPHPEAARLRTAFHYFRRVIWSSDSKYKFAVSYTCGSWKRERKRERIAYSKRTKWWHRKYRRRPEDASSRPRWSSNSSNVSVFLRCL